MTTHEVVSLIEVAVVRIGLAITIYRNGRGQAAKLGKFKGELENELKNINGKLGDDNYGLSALSTKIGDIKEHCSGVTSTFTEKFKSVDKTMDEIKSAASRRRSK